MHWQVQEEYLHPCPTGHVGDKASQAILISNATILRLPNIRQPQFHRGHPPPQILRMRDGHYLWSSRWAPAHVPVLWSYVSAEGSGAVFKNVSGPSDTTTVLAAEW
jgi:hypothetical protein